MSIRDLPITDGKIIVPFSEGQMSRASIAFSPDDGNNYRNDKPRIATSRLPKFKIDTKSLYENIIVPNSFDPNTTPFMFYDSTGGPLFLDDRPRGGLGGRLVDFENDFPEFDKLVLGTSSSPTYPKPILAYRLPQTGAADPLNTKHFVLSMCVHGNEANGADGTIKAVEIIARSPLFQNFRDEWTLLFIPAMNPDGWYNQLRNLEVVGPNGYTVNLNRNWDWFWSEYVESGAESKGSYPMDTAEAQALENYRIAVEAAGGRFGALYDQHATGTGVANRYQSRDRIYRSVLYGPGEGGGVPDNYLTIPLEYLIWKIHHGIDARRTRDLSPGDPGYDLMCRYYRSRFNPHMHTYYSSRGVFAMITENVKPTLSHGLESTGSACNFRLDYTLTVAAAITTDNWEFDDAVLIEKETENLFNNADWTDWQDASRTSKVAERPSYWSISRSRVERTTPKDGEKFYHDGGEGVKIIADLDIKLSAPAQYVQTTNDIGFDDDGDQVWGVVTIAYDPDTGIGNIHKFPSSDWQSGNLFPAGLVVHTTPVGAAIIYTQPGKVHVLGGGTFPFAGASTKITEIDTTIGAATETAIAPGGPWTARMHAGCADNFLDYTAATNYGYLVGGHNGVNFLSELGIWDANGGLGPSNTWIPSAHSLPTAVAGPGVVFNPDDGLVYIFGGLAAVGTPIDTIHTWDPVADTLTLLPATLPAPLAFMGAVYNPGSAEVYGTGRIYLYGGETTGGIFTYAVYEYDPTTQTFTVLEPIENVSDDESIEQEGDEGGPWIHKWGRMSSATFVESSADDGITVLMGGMLEVTIGSPEELVDGAYIHALDDNALGLAKLSDFGYIRRSTKLDFAFAAQVTEDFATSPTIFTDPNSNWTFGVGTATTGAIGGPLELVTVPTYINEEVECTVRKTGAGAIGDFALVARGTYTGAILTEGYRLNYSGITWTIQRVNSGMPTVLDTYVAPAAQQITTTARTVTFRVILRNPVRIIATVNGTEIFDIYDLDTDRINEDIGIVAVEGQSGVDDIEIGAFVLRTSGLCEERFASSIMVKAASDNVSGYVRQTFYPKDDSNLDGNKQFVTRRVRNYYTIPPKNMYHWYHQRLDLRESAINQLEDGLRYYERIYKHDQKVYLDGPHVHKGSLIASSFQHPDFPRSAETMTFPSAVDINAFRLKFRWMPTAGFPDLDEDMELVRIQLNEGNYIALIAKAGDRIREFNAGDIHGPHDPELQLIKVRTCEPCWNSNFMFNGGGYNINGPCEVGACTSTTEQSVTVVSYWGYDLRDPSLERVDEVMEFTITHFADKLFELRAERFGCEGNQGAVATASYAALADADIIYNGFGYYSQPEIIKAEEISKRKVPVGRKELIARSRSFAVGQLFTGDRDPMGGECGNVRTYWMTDDFHRADDPNLGNLWNIEKDVGDGFNIISNEAACTGQGFECFSPRPGHADYIVKATIRVDTDNDIVGVFGRIDSVASDITGYSAELTQTGAAAANLTITRWHLGVQEVLDTQALSSYTAGESLDLVFTLQGSSLQAEIIGRATATATDTNYSKPQRAGIYGITTGPSYVYIESFRLEPNFKLFITD